MERSVAHLPVRDLDHNRVYEQHRIDRIQRPRRLLGQFPGDLLRDAAGVLRDPFC
jgi:hypothetical protein